MAIRLGLIVLAWCGVAAGQPPSESELPKSVQPAAPRPTERRDEKQTDALPDETTLPPAAGAAPAPLPAGPLPLAGSPDGIPWLRLNLSGHTAPVRAVTLLGSGNRLCSAGDDKSVIVWRRDAQDRPWRYERTIRWQIQRGTRGRIYALAAAQDRDGKPIVAVAGEGAMGGTGEIVLIDPTTGDYVATLFDEANGHRQVVVALDYVQTPEGPALASESMDGRTILWTQNEAGLWQAKVALPDDRAANVPPQVARQRLAGRAFLGVLALDRERVVVAVQQDRRGRGIGWRLAVVNVATGEQSLLAGPQAPLHRDAVTAMVADAQRKRMASADGAGATYLWDLDANPVTVRRLGRQARTALALALDPAGKNLVVGAVADRSGAGAVEVWNIENLARPTQRATFNSSGNSSGNVLACSASDAADALAYTRGSDIVVRSADPAAPEQALRGATAAPLRVAFPLEEPYYRIGVGTQQRGDSPPPINHVFDTDRLRLTRSAGQEADTGDIKWLPDTWGRGDWRVASSVDGFGRRQWHLVQAGAQRARLPLTEERTGAYRSVCWIPGQDLKQPPLAAIGTSAGGILLVRVTATGEAPIVRRFRGHSSDVLSLAVSRDLRWLVSASADATVRVWPLGPAASESNTINRWGATFAIEDAAGEAAPQLFIASIREDGPLYFRGARQGDRVVSCEWIESGGRTEVTDSAQQLAKLTDAPWDGVVKFELQTGRQPSRSFQILPAWQQIASLVADENGEWAFWAPSGYYDASFEGHRLFGWQINRGLDELPDFFLAAQFRAVLERPAAMSRLLRSGTLEQAFRAAGTSTPADSASAIANAYRLKPEVTITSPPPGAPLGEGDAETKLRATIRTPAGALLTPPKAFANGVVAPESRLLKTTYADGDRLDEYEWRLAVPSDPQVFVQVVASTAEEITATAERVLENRTPRRNQSPRLFLLAVGVDQYRDAQIPKLRTPVRGVQALTDVVRNRSSRLYQISATSLVDQQARRSSWNDLAASTAEQLRQDATPDDLLMIYLSGHGVQDLAGDNYHFITANADFGEVMAGGYADCLSLEDFAQFADIPCRKLVILDTCHSGAIQPMRHREMKAAVRALQQDMLVTLAASHGSEEAIEGLFSKRLIEGLSGAADGEAGPRDGVVRFDELVAYVRRSVSADSFQRGFEQTPSAGPADLLPFVSPALVVGPGE